MSYSGANVSATVIGTRGVRVPTAAADLRRHVSGQQSHRRHLRFSTLFQVRMVFSSTPSIQ